MEDPILTYEELLECIKLYEDNSGYYWFPIENNENQNLWIKSFEQAKIYFNKMNK